jgi:hypothetical protein
MFEGTKIVRALDSMATVIVNPFLFLSDFKDYTFYDLFINLSQTFREMFLTVWDALFWVKFRS